MGGMMERNTRIELTDSVMDVVVKLAEGNPGAITVILGIMEHGKSIDPIPDPIMVLAHFDELGIYGHKIWELYKDVCHEDLVNVLTLMRGYQMGLIGREDLFEPRVFFGELADKVKEQLISFNPDNLSGIRV